MGVILCCTTLTDPDIIFGKNKGLRCYTSEFIKLEACVDRNLDEKAIGLELDDSMAILKKDITKKLQQGENMCLSYNEWIVRDFEHMTTLKLSFLNKERLYEYVTLAIDSRRWNENFSLPISWIKSVLNAYDISDKNFTLVSKNSPFLKRKIDNRTCIHTILTNLLQEELAEISEPILSKVCEIYENLFFMEHLVGAEEHKEITSFGKYQLMI